MHQHKLTEVHLKIKQEDLDRCIDKSTKFTALADF